MSQGERPVVVGVDGSIEATHAAQWAAAVADTSSAPLLIVHSLASVGHSLSDASIVAIHAAAAEEQRHAAEKLLQTIVDRIQADHPALTVTTTAVTEAAGPALIAASKEARLLVLACADVSPTGALLAGSTTLAVATHAICPVVGWRGEDASPTNRPVVVGVDGTPASEAALSAAFDFAHRVGAPLRAVRAWATRQPGSAVTIPYLVDWDAVENAQRRELTEAVSRWEARYPDVDVSIFVEPHKPSRALLHHLSDAQLVVVGNRNTNQLSSIVLGSTGLNMLHHSPVPVMVCNAAQEQL